MADEIGILRIHWTKFYSYFGYLESLGSEMLNFISQVFPSKFLRISGDREAELKADLLFR